MHEQKVGRSGLSSRKQVAPVLARQANRPGARSGVSTRKLVAATAVPIDKTSGERREKQDG
jgi:hypothetical protein